VRSLATAGILLLSIFFFQLDDLNSVTEGGDKMRRGGPSNLVFGLSDGGSYVRNFVPAQHLQKLHCWRFGQLEKWCIHICPTHMPMGKPAEAVRQLNRFEEKGGG
jgi:hypothetical protein